jgi:hypothetical protein
MGARFSLDAVRLGPRAEIRALVFRMMQYAPGVMYLCTARMKLLEGGAGWLGGPILFQHLQLDGWVRPPGIWLREHPSLCAALAAGTIAVEFLLPLLLVLPFWIRPARFLAIACNVGLQLGILLTLKVGVFTYVMLAISVLWILPEWLTSFGVGVKRLREQRTVEPWTPVRGGLGAALFLVFACVSAAPAVGRHVPAFVHRSLAWLGLNLAPGMFTRATPAKRWEAAGQLADGKVVDPFEVVAPNAFSNGFTNSHWMQLPYHLENFGGLQRYTCRRYNALAHGPKLESWTLRRVARPPHLPGEQQHGEAQRMLFRTTCSTLVEVARQPLGR